MQDEAEEVDVCLEGLRREEVMRLEGNSVLEFGREALLEGRLESGEVLDNEFQGGESLRDGDGTVAHGTANLVVLIS